jgi:hypothetical protein
MKKISPFTWLLILAGLSACSYQTYHLPQQLLYIPLEPHRNDVELYFNAELPAEKDYYKVIGLSVSGEDYNTLLIGLKEKGRQTGVDAIINVNQATYTIGGDIISSYQILQGVGIKYRKNMEYISRQLKQKNVYQYKNPVTEPVMIYQAPFHMMGHEIISNQRPDSLYKRYVRNFSLEFLLDDTQHWRYSEDFSGKVTVRQRMLPGSVNPVVTCRFTYNAAGNVNQINVTHHQSYPAVQHQIQLVYDDQGRVAEKQIYNRKKQLQYREVIHYDADDRVSRIILTRIRAGQENPFLRTDYEYYTVDELPAIQ